MTETQLRQQVCRQALSWLGRGEADGSHREILEVYNRIRPLPRGYRMKDTDPWCAAFVSAVGAACGLERILFPECGCGPMLERYRAAGRWMEADDYRPAPGDLIFFDWEDSGAGDNRGTPDHVGLVLDCDGDSLRVVEGNCGDSVAMTRRSRDGRWIRGYGLPDYAAAAGEETEETGSPEREPPETAPDGEGLPELRPGDRGEAVRAAQLLLIGRGCGCGPDGADGIFGSNTAGALLRFQRKMGLEADGVLGRESWLALILGRRR